ncbi:hypothetical protein [Mycobacterium sp. shizuoka-1]|uniref:hypothetical protein n=1 Tax=Mycobacterium sp. shizuoka-1 TaxID=2039281 RepID=UPI000C05DF36|nr:hypothetical protein [Mycobacterium sp. shizuoka-1]GAY18032.1 hypothetical protein MSZK_47580 [Mycobacterium sp. shizuoka-1]
MTPFMLRVSEVLDLPTDVDLPDIQASRRLPAAIGADAHVECRSLAEQLVCEANVVLTANDLERIELTDDVRVGALSFALTYGPRQARIVTTIGDDVAVGHLYGIGSRHLGNVELTGADQVEKLILLLVGVEGEDRDDTPVPETGTLAL